MNKTDSINSTTQSYLDIHDITDDILVLKDGSCALILSVEAVNFGLLAESEQDAIIYSYANLLNSLNFPLQILIVSKTKDVSGYLKSLEDQENQAFSDRKKQSIYEYRQFVGELIKERNVLDKKFYVVIPTSSLELGLVSAQSVIPGVKTQSITNFDPSVVLDKAFNNLYPKRDHLIAQFARIGLYARQLNTQEIIQVFYQSYNPGATDGQLVTNTQNYTSALVETQSKGEVMINANPTPPAQNNMNADAAQAAPVSNPMPEPTPTPTMAMPQPTTPTAPVEPVVPVAPVEPAAPSAPITPTAEPVVPNTPNPVPAMSAPTPTAETPEDVQSAINNSIQEMGTAQPAAPTAPATPTAVAPNTLPEI